MRWNVKDCDGVHRYLSESYYLSHDKMCLRTADVVMLWWFNSLSLITPFATPQKNSVDKYPTTGFTYAALFFYTENDTKPARFPFLSHDKVCLQIVDFVILWWLCNTNSFNLITPFATQQKNSADKNPTTWITFTALFAFVSRRSSRFASTQNDTKTTRFLVFVSRRTMVASETLVD